MTIHVGSDDTAVHSTLPPSGVTVNEPLAVFDPKQRLSPHVTATPRPFCETPNVLPAIVTVPLRGYTVLFASAAIVTVPGPTRDVAPCTVIHPLAFWMSHSTSLPTVTSTATDSPSAMNSYP